MVKYGNKPNAESKVQPVFENQVDRQVFVQEK
jgi:hypothetical protein